MTSLEAFFSKYDYVYDPENEVMQQFKELCDMKDWSKKSQAKKDAREELNAAISRQFNESYGTSVERLSVWQDLCRELRMDPVPSTIHDCRTAVKATYVNIVDLVQCRLRGTPVELHESEKALAVYSKKTGNIFPRDEANAGNLLKFLLRRIICPRPDGPRNPRRKKGRSGREHRA